MKAPTTKAIPSITISLILLFLLSVYAASTYANESLKMNRLDPSKMIAAVAKNPPLRNAPAVVSPAANGVSKPAATSNGVAGLSAPAAVQPSAARSGVAGKAAAAPAAVPVQ